MAMSQQRTRSLPAVNGATGDMRPAFGAWGWLTLRRAARAEHHWVLGSITEAILGRDGAAASAEVTAKVH
jgi:hypothetical protein